jgi:hypothetical protein
MSPKKRTKMIDNEIPIITRDKILTAQTVAERRAARPGKSDKTQVANEKVGKSGDRPECH